MRWMIHRSFLSLKEGEHVALHVVANQGCGMFEHMCHTIVTVGEDCQPVIVSPHSVSIIKNGGQNGEICGDLTDPFSTSYNVILTTTGNECLWCYDSKNQTLSKYAWAQNNWYEDHASQDLASLGHGNGDSFVINNSRIYLPTCHQIVYADSTYSVHAIHLDDGSFCEMFAQNRQKNIQPLLPFCVSKDESRLACYYQTVTIDQNTGIFDIEFPQ